MVSGFGYDTGFSGFDAGFSGVSIMASIIFVLVIGVFVAVFVKGISQWNKNEHSPRLTVPALVVAKRADVSYHHHHDNSGVGMGHTSRSTRYYVTFQVDSGDRMELGMSGQEFGMLVEGDRGALSFQGTRYLGFQRD